MKEQEIEFVGIKLTDESREKLLSLGLPKCDVIKLDHIVLEYGPKEGSSTLGWVESHLGETIEVKLKNLGYDIDERGSIYAFEVEDENILCKNDHPHITIGFTGSREAKESNDIKIWTPCNRITLTGVFYEKFKKRV